MCSRVATGTSVAAKSDVTFKSAAAVVVLATLTATPLTTFLCVSECVPAAVPAGIACHHQHNAASGAAITDSDDTCARLLVSSPFVIEDSQLITRAALPASAPHAFFASARGEAQLTAQRDAVAAVEHRPTSALVLRL